jgi:putative membrane protein
LISVGDLPAVNATLNGTSALLLVAGYIAIRKRRPSLHRALMLSALGASVLFLASYLFYHYRTGTTRFTGQGLARTFYFAVLTSHTILAMVIVPLVIVTLYLAIRENFPRHRRIARWTFPLWLYVSVTGIVVYVMLYHLFPTS